MAAKLHVRKTKERIGNCFTNPTPQNFKLLPSFLGASSVKRKHPAQMRKSPLDLMLHLLVFITARQSTELTSQQWKNSKVSNKRVSRKGTYTSRDAHAEQVTPHFAVCLRSSADWPQSWTSSGVKLPCLLRTSDLTCAMQE